jgi:DNA-binding MarR family transcriptional regulator
MTTATLIARTPMQPTDHNLTDAQIKVLLSIEAIRHKSKLPGQRVTHQEIADDLGCARSWITALVDGLIAMEYIVDGCQFTGRGRDWIESVLRD